jgi:hypothetical protein
MVLQQNLANPIWGWDTPGAQVTVTCALPVVAVPVAPVAAAPIRAPITGEGIRPPNTGDAGLLTSFID